MFSSVVVVVVVIVVIADEVKLPMNILTSQVFYISMLFFVIADIFSFGDYCEWWWWGGYYSI